MPPTAAVVAGAEPEMAAKKVAEITVTMPRPPVTWAIRAWPIRTRRRDRPPRIIRSPASTKPGMASSVNSWVP